MDHLLFENYIGNRNNVNMYKSNWSGPNDLGFYFRYIERFAKSKIYYISESLHLTRDKFGYMVNLVQNITNNLNNNSIEGAIEYHLTKKTIKFKSLNKDYFNFIKVIMFI